MAINPAATGIHHIRLRSTNFDVTENFYQNILGFPLVIDATELIIFSAAIFPPFKKANPRNAEFSSFSPFEVGLDYIPLTCESKNELHRFAEALSHAGVENTGVKTDAALNKLYVTFKDSNKIQWEFYMK